MNSLRRTTITTTTGCRITSRARTRVRHEKGAIALLRPDHYVSGVTAIDLDALRDDGITALLFDMDNTVSPHHSATVVPEIRDWLAALPSAGFGVRFVSNNWHDDIHARAAVLGYPVVAKAAKPLPFGIRRAMRDLGAAPSQCVLVGDQLFTDILGGALAGVTTILVDPITATDMAHTKVLRWLERRIMRDRRPEA